MNFLTNSKNRMLIRCSILTLIVVMSFGSTSRNCFASESNSIENGNSVDVENIATTEEADETAVANDEVISDDTLQADDTTEESGLSEELLSNINNVLTYILGIMIFFVVVLLCKYSYRFFNIFF